MDIKKIEKILSEKFGMQPSLKREGIRLYNPSVLADDGSFNVGLGINAMYNQQQKAGQVQFYNHKTGAMLLLNIDRGGWFRLYSYSQERNEQSEIISSKNIDECLDLVNGELGY